MIILQIMTVSLMGVTKILFKSHISLVKDDKKILLLS